MHSHLPLARRFLKRFGELHVVVPVFNPLRFVSRYSLLADFVKHAEDAGATVWIAELAFAERPFECTETGNPRHLQFRSKDEIWLKESLINAAVSRIPDDWEYLAWVDGDITFLNPDWVQETIQQLQHYAVVQMWCEAIDLDPNGRQLQCFKGFPASIADCDPWPTKGDYYHGQKGYFHPGYAWACRKYAWHKMGGLLDINIVGGGDHQMAMAYYGKIKQAIPFQSTPGYRKLVHVWQRNIADLKGNVGCVPGTIAHHWHGKKINRGYWNRWQILAENKFDPAIDLKRDRFGVWQLSGTKPKLRDDLRAYFRARSEDSIDA